jgi:hypothetical protein
MYKKILKLANSVDADNRKIAESLCKSIGLDFKTFHTIDYRNYEGNRLTLNKTSVESYVNNIDIFEADEYKEVWIQEVNQSNLEFKSQPALQPKDFVTVNCNFDYFKKWVDFSRVENISIYDCDNFKQESFKDLPRLENIKFLRLSRLKHIKNIDIKHMVAFEKIEYFYLVNDKGFGRSNKDIYELEVDNLRVFKNLKEIRLELVNINEKMIDDICSIKSLETIVLINNKQEIPKEWFLRILSCNSAVKYLSISDKSGVLLFDSSKRKV